MRYQKALQDMCSTISQGNRNTIVGYGDAGFHSSSKGLAPTPITALRRHFGTTCRLIARRVRENNVYSLLLPGDADMVREARSTK
ncbi:hypothetical protein ABBQ32_000619 [Trebouxia sp. C0010 RCD-2024]